MKDSVKANLLVFFIIAIISFAISATFAGITITENEDSYKLVAIENDSFEPNYINKVPTIIPKAEPKNYTNNTTSIQDDIDENYTDTTVNESIESWNETYSEYWEY